MKSFKTVAKFLNTVGLLSIMLVKLLEGLRNYAYQKFLGVDEEQQFLDHIIIPIKKDLQLLRKEIQDKHLTSEDLDTAISEAILNENELGNNLLRGTPAYKLLNNIQTELSDVLHVERSEDLTENVFSNRLKKSFQKIRKDTPDLLTPDNVSEAFNFIVEKAVRNESLKKFDYKSLLAAPEKESEEENPYLSYLKYKPVPPSKFKATASATQDQSIRPRMQTYDKLLEDLKIYTEESTAKLYKKIEDDMNEQVAKLQKALAAPRTMLPLLDSVESTITSFSPGDQTFRLEVPETVPQLPNARL